jgi:hypothetical protein
VGPSEHEMGVIVDGPLDDFAFGEVHGLSESRWDIDIPLLTVLALDELDFGGVAHEQVSMPVCRLSQTKNDSLHSKGQTPVSGHRPELQQTRATADPSYSSAGCRPAVAQTCGLGGVALSLWGLGSAYAEVFNAKRRATLPPAVTHALGLPSGAAASLHTHPTLICPSCTPAFSFTGAEV